LAGYPHFGCGATGTVGRTARLDKERDAAIKRYRKDRDAAALEKEMRRLGADEAIVGRPIERRRPSLEARRTYLESLPRFWLDADARDRKRLAEALFERVYVLGTSTVVVVPTRQAAEHGLTEAIPAREVEMVGARGVGPALSN
jgi:hypothetical protein